MNRIVQKNSIYGLCNFLICGCILAFEIYYLLPETFQHLFTSNTLIWGFSYILFSLLFGLLNDSLSEYVIRIYENGRLVSFVKIILHWLLQIWHRLTNKDYTKIWNSVTDKFNTSLSDDETVNDVENEAVKQENNLESSIVESEIISQEEVENSIDQQTVELDNESLDDDSEEIAEAAAESKDIEERIFKKRADGKVDLYDYIENYYLPEVFKESSDNEIDEYVYLFLLNSSIRNRLNEFISSQSLIKDLSSLCVLSAVMILFMHISKFLIVTIIYKIIVLFVLIMLGYIFYQEYLHTVSKLKRYNLIWFLQLKEDPKYAKEMGIDALFKKENA